MARPCDALEAQLDGLFNDSGLVKKLNKDYSSFYSLLADLTGYSKEKFPQKLYHIRDTLFCEVSQSHEV